MSPLGVDVMLLIVPDRYVSAAMLPTGLAVMHRPIAPVARRADMRGH